MAVSCGKANMGKATHESKPSSTLSKQQYVTKPENRHPTTHKYNVSGAMGILGKHHK